jgi:hypothetical protein
VCPRYATKLNEVADGTSYFDANEQTLDVKNVAITKADAGASVIIIDEDNAYMNHHNEAHECFVVPSHVPPPYTELHRARYVKIHCISNTNKLDPLQTSRAKDCTITQHLLLDQA